MEKNRKNTFDFHQRWEKILLILRTALFFLIISAFTMKAEASAQVIKITMKMENATIDELIKNVRTETNYRFLYRIEEVNKYGKRNVNLQDASIEEFLKTILTGTKLSYEIENDVIIIRPSKDDDKKTKAPRNIKGIVYDNLGATLPGATIMIKGTTLGVVTDIDGKFELEIPQMDSITLVISFVGFQTLNLPISNDPKNDNKELVIKLKEDITEMDEVVITGYGKVRKESFTGSSVSVSKEQLMKVSKTNVLKALQAFDPSFRIQTNNQWGSDPNALPEMYIRGRSGVGVKQLDANYTNKGNLKNNPNLPTFIMDGFEISVQKLYDMDPSRIANITILKDAAATALYGSRAANGVVIITTVAPKPGKMNIQYGLTGEITMPDLSAYNLMNAKEKLETERLAGAFEPYSSDPSESLELKEIYYGKQNNIVKGVDTYWLSLPLQTAFNHKHSLFVEGGSENLRFGVDLSYYNEDGVMKGSFRDRLGAGVTIDYHLTNLQVRNQTTYNITKSKETPYGSFSNFANALPYNTYKDEAGRYLEELEDWGENGTFPNPMYEASLSNFDKSQTEEFINNLSVNWNVGQYWLLKGQFSLTRQINKSRRFLDPQSKQNTNPLSSFNSTSGELHTTDGNSFSWDMQATLSYNRTIDKHNLNFLLGMNQRASKTESISAEYRGFPSGALNSPNYAEEIYQKPTSSENSTRLVGFLGTLNYSYNNIYLLDASVRLDGSSEFGSDRRFAPFGSFGVGINIHNYEFMKNWGKLDLLKIRGTYGETGKVNFPAYVARTTFKILSDEWYKTGFGATLMAFGNKKLTWETTKEYNLGIEIGLLQDLVYIDATYYRKKTVDLINDVTIPSSTGFTTYTDNIGEVENKGFELNLRTNVIRQKDLLVALFANLAHNKNKILKISESLKAYNDSVDQYFKDNRKNSKPFMKYVEGGSLTSIFGMRSLGIDPATGEEIFLTRDGEQTTTWSSNEQVILGNTEPDAQGTFGVNVTWKNWSLYATFMYEFGGQEYNQTLVDKVENANIYLNNVDKRILTDRWQKPGDIKKYQKLAIKERAGSVTVPITRPTERFVQKNNNLSLNSITLGYSLQAESYRWLKTTGISMLRFEIGANELFYWSSIKAERGLSYPFARTMNFSLNLTF
ncbi:SusC/RagA family TonB-linked outer membrane protein [Butyricimonas hominis]|uniref:SusC/RagA family TonB-linked outer membrane protein n=1 Tax=Butyricimonas TaxID=574697 RepID=UPI003517F145